MPPAPPPWRAFGPLGFAGLVWGLYAAEEALHTPAWRRRRWAAVRPGRGCGPHYEFEKRSCGGQMM